MNEAGNFPASVKERAAGSTLRQKGEYSMSADIWWNLLLVWYLLAGIAFVFWYGDEENAA